MDILREHMRKLNEVLCYLITFMKCAKFLFDCWMTNLVVLWGFTVFHTWNQSVLWMCKMIFWTFRDWGSHLKVSLKSSQKSHEIWIVLLNFCLKKLEDCSQKPLKSSKSQIKSSSNFFSQNLIIFKYSY